MDNVDAIKKKQDAIHNADFQIRLLENTIKSTDNKIIRSIMQGSLDALEELISVIENEHKKR